VAARERDAANEKLREREAYIAEMEDELRSVQSSSAQLSAA
jgi:hypothetical protein